MSKWNQIIQRRTFLKWLGFSLAGIFSVKYLNFNKQKKNFSSEIVGSNYQVGHILRDKKNTLPSKTIECGTLIVGAGIAGLSAGWWLKKKGYDDYTILELDKVPGGNSRSGANSISRYPYGAHYLPLPNKEAVYVTDLLEEMKILKGYKNLLPVYDEFSLCADPHERLFFQGRWQDGLVPNFGLKENVKNQFDRFYKIVADYKYKKGRDGKFAFTIPLALSSQDSDFLKLDKLSMKEFLIQNKLDSEVLFWHINYCTRDDYGACFDKVSAWAGLHYFCSRRGKAANADSQTVLTWPEGNGHFVDYLSKINSDKIKTNQLALEINSEIQGISVDALDVSTQTLIRYKVKNLIYSAPRYTADKVIVGYNYNSLAEYYPWVIANISLRSRPKSEGAPLSWDNLSYYSPSLGYILANHQDLKFNQESCVITYYLPWNQGTARESRLNLKNTSEEKIKEFIVQDLEKMHPNISKSIVHLDLWFWGHGMNSPGIDFLWNKRKTEFSTKWKQIYFAHSDMSGISIFEEAQFHGVEAAKRVLEHGELDV